MSGKHPGGRPTSCTPEFLDKARNYLANYKKLGDPVPTVAGLACETGVHRGTLQRWAEEADKPEFHDIYLHLMASQERGLVSGGLAGGFNAAVTKMILTKHGYSDKIEQEVKAGITVNIEDKDAKL